jgi:hypothetical protein
LAAIDYWAIDTRSRSVLQCPHARWPDKIAAAVMFDVSFALNLKVGRTQFHRNATVGFTLSSRTEGVFPLERCDEYRHFAEACIELARHHETPQERAVLLQMALIWSRLAERAAAFANETS